MYEALSDFINTIAKIFIEEVTYQDYYQQLAYETKDLTLIYWSLFLVPLLAMITFHKIWDPVQKGKKGYFIMLLVIAIAIIGVTYFELFNNSFIVVEIEAFASDDTVPDPYFFVFPYGLVIAILGVILGGGYSMLTKFISKNNNKLPF